MASSKIPELQNLLSLCELHLDGIVGVQSYTYTSCYLWHDRPLYNDFGEQIEVLNGDTIYLNNKAASLSGDLFHELGHLISRKYQLTGNRENGYHGSWEQQNSRLIAQVSEQRHFMLWHLQPDLPEANLIDTTMSQLNRNADCQAVLALACEVRLIS